MGLALSVIRDSDAVCVPCSHCGEWGRRWTLSSHGRSLVLVAAEVDTVPRVQDSFPSCGRGPQPSSVGRYVFSSLCIGPGLEGRAEGGSGSVRRSCEVWRVHLDPVWCYERSSSCLCVVGRLHATSHCYCSCSYCCCGCAISKAQPRMTALIACCPDSLVVSCSDLYRFVYFPLCYQICSTVFRTPSRHRLPISSTVLTLYFPVWLHGRCCYISLPLVEERARDPAMLWRGHWTLRFGRIHQMASCTS